MRKVCSFILSFLCLIFCAYSVGNGENAYRFEKGMTLIYKLELNTEIHFDTKNMSRFIPVHSLYRIRFHVLDKDSEGNALIGATSHLEAAPVVSDSEGLGDVDSNDLDFYKKWIADLEKEDSAALVLDRFGNIARGRMPWPESTCFHLPKILEGLSIKKMERGFPLGGRFQIDNIASETVTQNGKAFTIYRTQNRILDLILLYSNQGGLPMKFEAKYGYTTFRSVFMEHFKLELIEIVSNQSEEAFLSDDSMMAALIQAALLSRKYNLNPEIIRLALQSGNSRLRILASSYCSTSGILDAFDVVDMEKERDEVVKFNLIKAVFKKRRDSLQLESFSKESSPEIKLRAKKIFMGKIEAPAASGDIFCSTQTAKEAYQKARHYQLARNKEILHLGPRSFAIKSGDDGNRIFHYSVYVPEDYDPAEVYPCLIELSGGNGFSESMFLQSNKVVKYNYILVSPDADYGMWWEQDQIQMFDDLLKRIVRDYAVDPDRIYLHGFSNGGIGAYIYGFIHADRLAAVASLEGYSKIVDGRRGIETEMSLNMRNTPLLIMHGERDNVISIEPNRFLVEFLNRNSIPHKFIQIHNEGHNITFAKYHTRIMDFFRSHQRNPAPEKIYLVVDDTRYNRNFWVRVDEKIDPKERARVEAERKKEKFVLKTKNVKKVSLLLNDWHYEEGKPYEVLLNKKSIFRGSLTFDPAVLLDSLENENDYARLYGVRLTFDIE
jgi:hypothetical protein